MQIKAKDTIISNLNLQIVNFNKIIATKDKQKQIQENLQKDLEKAEPALSAREQAVLVEGWPPKRLSASTQKIALLRTALVFEKK